MRTAYTASSRIIISIITQRLLKNGSSKSSGIQNSGCIRKASAKCPPSASLQALVIPQDGHGMPKYAYIGHLNIPTKIIAAKIIGKTYLLFILCYHRNISLQPNHKNYQRQNIFYIQPYPSRECKTFSRICLIHKIAPTPSVLVVGAEKHVEK